MARIIVAGIDGSRESGAAAHWAAREAELRGARLRLVHAWEPVPDNMVEATWLGADTLEHWSGRIPRRMEEEVRDAHPALGIEVERVSGRAADALTRAARSAELLVLGSRALGGVSGFLVGSVGQAVVAHTETPVVLVRARGRGAEDGDDREGGDDRDGGQERDGRRHGDVGAGAAFGSDLPGPTVVDSAVLGPAVVGPVVLGLDAGSPDDTVLAFAFEEAARRGVALRVVRGWGLPPSYAYAMSAGVDPYDEAGRDMAAELAEVLQPWRAKYPGVEVVELSRAGSPAAQVVEASLEAGLVVVGRRIRRGPVGPHIGPVTHAVLHHSVAPVAVVAHN